MPIDLDTVDPWDPDNEGCLKEGYEQCEKCDCIFDTLTHPYDLTEVWNKLLCDDCIKRMVEGFMKGEGNATIQD